MVIVENGSRFGLFSFKCSFFGGPLSGGIVPPERSSEWSVDLMYRRSPVPFSTPIEVWLVSLLDERQSSFNPM